MKQQFYFLLGALIALPLFPFLLYLGKKVRRNIPQLGEATKNLNSEIMGSQEKIHLLCLGESTFAGVGVNDHQEGIVGQIAQSIHQHTGKTITWNVLAKSGYTAKQVSEILVPQIQESAFDFIIIGLGGNDTFKLSSPLSFRNNFIKLIKAIRAKQPTATIVIANLPPVGEFPAFPPLLQFFLGHLVRLHGEIIADLPSLFKNVRYANKQIRFNDWLNKINQNNATVNSFFSDGVHPSALTYTLWGKEIATLVIGKELL
ncbi:MAG: SGNH/GDSL hydrolase family protein [Thermoflexibacter sp.]|jgi:lysophospholipase L1-like esterase|nr:SGNH/GDSL hydrolase family protein [Thermoflexibacter sp.]